MQHMEIINDGYFLNAIHKCPKLSIALKLPVFLECIPLYVKSLGNRAFRQIHVTVIVENRGTCGERGPHFGVTCIFSYVTDVCILETFVNTVVLLVDNCHPNIYYLKDVWSKWSRCNILVYYRSYNPNGTCHSIHLLQLHIDFSKWRNAIPNGGGGGGVFGVNQIIIIQIPTWIIHRTIYCTPLNT